MYGIAANSVRAANRGLLRYFLITSGDQMAILPRREMRNEASGRWGFMGMATRGGYDSGEIAIELSIKEAVCGYVSVENLFIVFGYR